MKEHRRYTINGKEVTMDEYFKAWNLPKHYIKVVQQGNTIWFNLTTYHPDEEQPK